MGLQGRLLVRHPDTRFREMSGSDVLSWKSKAYLLGKRLDTCNCEPVNCEPVECAIHPGISIVGGSADACSTGNSLHRCSVQDKKLESLTEVGFH